MFTSRLFRLSLALLVALTPSAIADDTRRAEMQALFSKARVLQSQGKYVQSNEAYEKYLKLLPKKEGPLDVKRSRIYYSMG